MAAPPARVNRGRQKIPMRKIENEAYRAVTFSKRKSSILKTSSELCTLTGAELAVMIRSEGNKTFSFGHPQVQAIVDRFQLVNPEHLTNTYNTGQFFRSFNTIDLQSLNAEYSVVNDEFLTYKQQKEALARKERVCEMKQRYKRSLGGMYHEELDSFERDLVKLHGIVAQQSEELQERQAQLRHQNVAVRVERGFGGFVPSIASLPGPFHEGSSSSHNAMRSGYLSSSSLWPTI